MIPYHCILTPNNFYVYFENPSSDLGTEFFTELSESPDLTDSIISGGRFVMWNRRLSKVDRESGKPSYILFRMDSFRISKIQQKLANVQILDDNTIKLINISIYQTESINFILACPRSKKLPKVKFIPIIDTNSDLPNMVVNADIINHTYNMVCMCPRSSIIINIHNFLVATYINPDPGLTIIRGYTIDYNKKSIFNSTSFAIRGRIENICSYSGLCIGTDKSKGIIYVWKFDNPDAIFTLKTNQIRVSNSGSVLIYLSDSEIRYRNLITGEDIQHWLNKITFDTQINNDGYVWSDRILYSPTGTPIKIAEPGSLFKFL